MAETPALLREARNRVLEIFSQEMTCEKFEMPLNEKILKTMNFGFFSAIFPNDSKQNHAISLNVSVGRESAFNIGEKMISK